MTRKNEERFSKEIGAKENRKLNAMREKKRSIWVGFGTFGMIGWSIVVPTVLGTALGLWLDKNYPDSFSWTLTFLVAGLFVGCAIAWQWVDKENKAMHQDNSEKNE